MIHGWILNFWYMPASFLMYSTI